MITVYTQPGCGPCKQAIAALDVHGVQYQVIDIREDPESLEHIKELGATGTPVIENDEGFCILGYGEAAKSQLENLIKWEQGYWLH